MAENDEIRGHQPQSSPRHYDTQWATIEKALNDGYNTFMVGQTTMEDYEAAIEAVRSQGLDDIIAEYTEAYEAVN